MRDEAADVVGGPIGTGLGHSDAIYSVAYAPDGGRLVSGSC